VIVPPYLPDNDVVRRDILDYYVEIEHFDQMLGRALDLLEKMARSTTPLSSSPAITACRFPVQRQVCTMRAREFRLPSVGPPAFNRQVESSTVWSI
jgi:hypothetical protein